MIYSPLLATEFKGIVQPRNDPLSIELDRTVNMWLWKMAVMHYFDQDTTDPAQSCKHTISIFHPFLLQSFALWSVQNAASDGSTVGSIREGFQHGIMDITKSEEIEVG